MKYRKWMRLFLVMWEGFCAFPPLAACWLGRLALLGSTSTTTTTTTATTTTAWVVSGNSIAYPALVLVFLSTRAGGELNPSTKHFTDAYKHCFDL